MGEKQKFILNELMSSSINGALQHNKVYKANIPTYKREEFKLFLKYLLYKQIDTYKIKQNTDKHLDVMRRMQEETAQAFGEILEYEDMFLKKNTLSLGTVQKLLNLFLKYLWVYVSVLNFNVTPPHCPFDRVVITELRRLNPDLRLIENWTTPRPFEDGDGNELICLSSNLIFENHYIDLVNAAAKVASGEENIPMWELELFNRLNYKNDFRD